jgi:hypothetical protein
VLERLLARVGQLQNAFLLSRHNHGVLIYAPLAVYGTIEFLRTGAVSIWAAALACIIGGSYHFWSAAYHEG